MTQDPEKPEFARWDSYQLFARYVRFQSRYVLGDEEKAFLATVLKTIRGRDVELKEGSTFFRAQLGVNWEVHKDGDGNWIGESVYGYPAARMKPLTNRAKEGRTNPVGIPVLYVGTTLETAVSEIRPWVGAEVSVARCRLLRPLKTLNLTLGHGKSSLGGPIFFHLMDGRALSAEEKENAVWVDIDNAFSEPVTHSDDRADYAPTQLLAELFRQHGYDAIGYKSHFGDDEEQQRGGFNIAIFDPSAVEIVTCAPYRVDTIKVSSSQIGNDWFKSTD